MQNLARTIFAFLFLLSCGVVSAQESTDEPSDASIEEEGPETEPADPLETHRAKGGDIIIMKSGAIMSGVQVLRSSTTKYYVFVVEGVAPLEIPRASVETIEYDDVDLVKRKRRKELFPDIQQEYGLEGVELSPALLRKMRTPVTDEALSLEEKDYLELLDQFVSTKNIPVTIHDSIKNMKPENRVWTKELDRNMSLAKFLHKNLLADFPKLHLKYELESITLMTQKAKENMEKAAKEKEEKAQDAASKIKFNLNK